MKLYPYPKPHIAERRKAFSTRVIRWMGRNALRRITEFRKASGRFPTLDELQSWLQDHCTAALDHFEGKFERMAEEAALFALTHYDLDEHAVRVERARNGGTKSRRGASYTTDQLREVEHLSITQQAEALGCTPRTISRIRARLKAEEAARQDAEVDALVGPAPLQEPTVAETFAAITAPYVKQFEESPYVVNFNDLVVS